MNRALPEKYDRPVRGVREPVLEWDLARLAAYGAALNALSDTCGLDPERLPGGTAQALLDDAWDALDGAEYSPEEFALFALALLAERPEAGPIVSLLAEGAARYLLDQRSRLSRGFAELVPEARVRLDGPASSANGPSEASVAVSDEFLWAFKSLRTDAAPGGTIQSCGDTAVLEPASGRSPISRPQKEARLAEIHARRVGLVHNLGAQRRRAFLFLIVSAISISILALWLVII